MCPEIMGGGLQRRHPVNDFIFSSNVAASSSSVLALFEEKNKASRCRCYQAAMAESWSTRAVNGRARECTKSRFWVRYMQRYGTILTISSMRVRVPPQVSFNIIFNDCILSKKGARVGFFFSFFSFLPVILRRIDVVAHASASFVKSLRNSAR